MLRSLMRQSMGVLIICTSMGISFLGVEIAQSREVCVETKEKVGTLRFIAKNSVWFVNRASPSSQSLSLWFRRSLTSDKMPELVESGIQIYPKINDQEKQRQSVGNRISITLDFDSVSKFQFFSKLQRKTASTGPYYFMPWSIAVSPDQHADIFDAARQANSVTIRIADARNGTVLRESKQSLDRFSETVENAQTEHRRLLNEQPIGSCSNF